VTARTYLLWLFLALVTGAAFAQSPSAIKWAPDLAAAKQASTQFRVPLLIHFYGDACTPCRTLEKNVLSHPEVIQVLNKFFICVSINGSREQRTMAEYDVHSFPTDVFVSPSGERLHQGVSPQDVQNYLGMLQRVAVMNRDKNVVAASKKEINNANSSQQAMTTAGTLVSANGSNTRSEIPGLPPPGFNNPSNQQQSGHYKAAEGSTQQQLSQGASSSNVVQSGPLLGSQQPVSITGSAPQSQHLVGGIQNLNSSVAHAKSELEGLPFPPLSGQANAPIPQLNHQTTAQMGAYAQLPTIPPQALNSLANQVNTTVSQWKDTGGKSSSTLENPHFKSQVTNTVATGTAAVAGQLVSANDQLSNALTQTPVQNIADGSSNGSSTEMVGRMASAQLKQELPISIDGYCPVSLRGKQWKKGDQQYTVKHRGMLFAFIDATCRDEFLQAPDRYTPILFGNDPMLLLKEGKLVPGSTQFGLFEDKVGALFFTSAQSKAEFLQDFERNMQQIEQIVARAAVR
jgi:thioredoxin-related protein